MFIGLILLLSLLPVIILWLYYFSAHAWLSVESCMAILQTNSNEAKEYVLDHLNLTSSIGICFMVIVGYVLMRLIMHTTINKFRQKPIAWVFLFVLLNILMIYRTRENIMTNIAWDTKAYAASYNEYLKYRDIRKENIKQLSSLNNSGDSGIYVLVIGESETRDHMNSYGYERDTTPWMTKMKGNNNIVQFNKAFSCAADTISALTYALTNKNQYNDIELNKAVSVIDIANIAGYETVWLSNQAQYGLADTPVTAIATEANQQIWVRDRVGHLKDGRYLDVAKYCDDKIIPAIDKIKIYDKMLIVIHLMGSHNSYRTRYPKQYDYFDSASYPKHINEYDNTIRYTDSVLESIYSKMSKLKNFKAMLYFSDHGEGIDKNLQHDINNFTPQMTRIPMVMFLSDSYLKKYPLKYSVIQIHQNDYFTNDLIFNTIIGLMDINVGSLNESLNSIVSKGYDSNYDRFRTLYGKSKLSDE